MNELFARLVTIERLLMVLLSDPTYGAAVEQARRDIYEEYEAPLSRLFPSDPGYADMKAVSDHFGHVVELIQINHKFGFPE